MKLSVIIVNYNVRAYLEQCLRTVFEALEGVDGDVFVVDNQSTDGSVEMVREKFPGKIGEDNIVAASAAFEYVQKEMQQIQEAAHA